jgi:hypothetical protein
MAEVTLDSIRESVEKKYESYDVRLDKDTVVKLRNPIRLPRPERKQLQDLQKSMSADGTGVDEMLDLLEQAIRLVADPHAAPGQALLDAIDGDDTMLMGIFSEYMSGEDVGEASPSQS